MKQDHLNLFERLFSSLSVCALLAACAAGSGLSPSQTTYPAEEVTEVRNIVPIPLPMVPSVNVRLSGEQSDLDERISYSPGKPVLRFVFNTKEIGDSAETEIYIIPRNSSEYSENALLARVSEGGQKYCGSNFRISSTKYFSGGESTLQYFGVQTPALRVVYRCPIRTQSSFSPDALIIQEASREYPDSTFFDISTFAIPAPEDATTEAMKVVAHRRGLQMETNPLDNGTILLAERRYRGSVRFTPERWIALVRSSSAGSSVTIRHFSYREATHERGVRNAGTYQLGYTHGAQPVDRRRAYAELLQLMNEVFEAL